MAKKSPSSRRPTGAPSIRQLANQLGISPATASLALRQSTRISAAMRAKVQAAAEAAGYRPDPAVARVMAGFRQQRRAGTRGTIAAIFPPGMRVPTDPLDQSAIAFAGIRDRAHELGYQLDHFELGRDGLTGARLESVLKARGIEGLVIMHAVPAIAQLPMNLEDFSVIAIGLSVRQPLPRVCLHQYQDMQTLCFELIARGYRRPGLILSHDLNERSNYQFSAAYLAISQFHLRGLRIPIFFSDESPSTQLRHWLRKHRPDAVIFHHVDTSLTTVRAEAKALGLKTPAQLGIASLDLRIGHGAPSGLRQGWETLGKRAAEAVIMRVYHGLKGPSVQPSIEMITGEWIDGGTAPTRAAP